MPRNGLEKDWLSPKCWSYEEVFDYIEGDSTVFEKEPLTNLAADGQLMSYVHNGFWKCMDTQREKMELETMWQSGKAPWKVWN